MFTEWPSYLREGFNNFLFMLFGPYVNYMEEREERDQVTEKRQTEGPR